MPVVLVTGAVRRIGSAIVEHLSALGEAVIVHTSPRSQDMGTQLVQRLRTQGRPIQLVSCDLSELRAADYLMKEASAFFGPITHLVNNAAIFEPDSPDQWDRLGWDRHFSVNLMAPIQLVAALFSELPTKGEGAVVNILDQRVLQLAPSASFFSYTLSKSALWTATQMMARHYAPRLRINAVAPGPTLPNSVEGSEGFEQEVIQSPLQHAVAPQEIAEATAFLLQARSITGQIIAVDSGQHLL